MICAGLKSALGPLRGRSETTFAQRGGRGGQLGAILCKLFRLEVYIKRWGEGSKISKICKRSLCTSPYDYDVIDEQMKKHTSHLIVIALFPFQPTNQSAQLQCQKITSPVRNPGRRTRRSCPAAHALVPPVIIISSSTCPTPSRAYTG